MSTLVAGRIGNRTAIETPPSLREWLRRSFESSQPGRLPALEGARGLAILFVFLIHLHEFLLPLAPAGPLTRELVGFLYTVGNLAGDFFLVVTGCVIYRSLLAKPVPYFQFIRRRLSRIYSVFLWVLTLYLVLSMLYPASSKLPVEPNAALVYVLSNIALLPGLLPIQPIITVSWTLSFIALYYLTMPLIIDLTGMRRWTARRRVMFFAVLLILSAALGLETGLIPLRLNMLIVGVFVAEALAAGRADPQPIWLQPGMLAISVLCIAERYLAVHWRHVSAYECCQTAGQTLVTAVCLFCYCYCILTDEPATDPSPLRALLCWTPLRWLGNMSFSYYLSHSLAIKFFAIAARPWIAAVTRSDFSFWAVQPLIFVFSLAPAVLLFLLVERRSFSPSSKNVREKPCRLSTAAPQLALPHHRTWGSASGGSVT